MTERNKEEGEHRRETAAQRSRGDGEAVKVSNPSRTFNICNQRERFTVFSILSLKSYCLASQ
jgi:hypothetical protein